MNPPSKATGAVRETTAAAAPEQPAATPVDLFAETLAAPALDAPAATPTDTPAATPDEESVDAPAEKHGVLRTTFQAFQYVNFRWMWFGAFTSTTGYFVQEVAQSWLVYDITRS